MSNSVANNNNSSSSERSSTTTVTLTHTHQSNNSVIEKQEKSDSFGSSTLTLKAKTRRKVRWSADTVDNEHLGKKKSKVCCIYHKARGFDESSSEESDSDEAGWNKYEIDPSKRRRKRRDKCKHEC